MGYVPSKQTQLQTALNALAGDVAWKHRIIVLPPSGPSVWVLPPRPTLGPMNGLNNALLALVAFLMLWVALGGLTWTP